MVVYIFRLTSIVRLTVPPGRNVGILLYEIKSRSTIDLLNMSPLVSSEAYCATAPFVAWRDQRYPSARSATVPNSVLRVFGGLVGILRDKLTSLLAAINPAICILGNRFMRYGER